MLLTVTNLLTTELAIGFPLNVTLTENGGAKDAVTLGVSMRDLKEGEDKGDPAYKRLNLLRQDGSVTMTVAVDATTSDVLDEANEVA